MENDDCVECIESWDTLYCCLDGIILGPCESEYCGGGCEYAGECECSCHC